MSMPDVNPVHSKRDGHKGEDAPGLPHPAAEVVTDDFGEVLFHPQASELGKRAVLAFRRELPRLLREKPNWWVAYSGDERVGIAKDPTELDRECLRRGIAEADYIVRPIEPLPPDVVFLDE
jgi:hypothetical protein